MIGTHHHTHSWKPFRLGKHALRPEAWVSYTPWPECVQKSGSVLGDSESGKLGGFSLGSIHLHRPLVFAEKSIFFGSKELSCGFSTNSLSCIAILSCSNKKLFTGPVLSLRCVTLFIAEMYWLGCGVLPSPSVCLM